MVDYDSWLQHVLVIVISLGSGWLAKLLHNSWHEAFGVSQVSILGITAVLGLVAAFGYDLWIYLSEVEFNKAVYYLSIVSAAGVHYLSHVYSQGFTFVGDVVFWLFAIGTGLQYYLSNRGGY